MTKIWSNWLVAKVEDLTVVHLVCALQLHQNCGYTVELKIPI
jgi:hypothetical protein